MYWDKDGKSTYNPHLLDWMSKDPLLSLDGVQYHQVGSDNVPPGYCTVPVLIDDNGHEIPAEMLAGSIGWNCTSSGLETSSGKRGPDTMQPRSGWWIYEKFEAPKAV